MIEIHPNLFIGNEYDYETIVRHEPGWCIVHACKEPYHRQALGYPGRAAPKSHPEYLIAIRGNRLILNLVDAPDPAYIPKELINAALEFVSTSLGTGNRVLVHCNEGCSRSAGIGLLYLAKFTDKLPKEDFLVAETAFRSIYPPYNPKSGMRGFVMGNWNEFVDKKEFDEKFEKIDNVRERFEHTRLAETHDLSRKMETLLKTTQILSVFFGATLALVGTRNVVNTP